MKAQFGGLCPECGEWIHAGDEIENIAAPVGGITPVWAHATCSARPEAKVCPKCFMEMALSGEHNCEEDR